MAILDTVPTILRIGRFRVVIYPNDHRPAHVHVMGNECEAMFVLNCAAASIRLRENYGFTQRELTSIEKVLAEHFHELCQAWEKIHGHEE